MKEVDVLVIGGSAAGLVTALTGKAHYPEKEFLWCGKNNPWSSPAGIPYMFGSLEHSGQNVIPDTKLEKLGVDLTIGGGHSR